MASFTFTEQKIRKILYDPRLNSEGVLQGIKECDKAVRAMNAAMKKSTTIGEKQHLTTTLGVIKSYRQMFKALQVAGQGYSPVKETAKHRVRWEDTATAFKGRIRTGTIINIKHKDVENFLDDCKILFRRRANNLLKQWEAIKVNVVFVGLFSCFRAEQEVEDIKHLPTSNAEIYRSDNIDEWFDINVKQAVLVKLEEFQQMGSGWSLKEILNLQVNINKHHPKHGASYIKLPAKIAAKEACVNVKNNDEACFAWAVTSALYPVDKARKNISRTSSYPHYSSVLNLKNIVFPMTLRQIPRFEKQNNISINVYLLKKSKYYNVVPVYLTKNKQEKHVNLLMVHDQYNVTASIRDAYKYHFVWIKNLSRLTSKQHSNHNGKKFFCDRCLRYFHSQEKIDRHSEDCKNLNTGKVRLPKNDDKILKFKDYKYKEPQPYILYADIESVLKPICEKNKYQEHLPAAIGYYVKCSYDDSLSYFRAYRGQDCIDWFVKELDDFKTKMSHLYIDQYPIDPLTAEEEQQFQQATLCHICEQPFSEDDKKVRDHFHMASGRNNNNSTTTNYRGPAHDSCNLQYQDSAKIPIVLHNLSSYDSHLIIKSIALKMGGDLDVLPVTKEKYISFTLRAADQHQVSLRFIDSFRFMNKGLADLVSNLQPEQLNITRKHFPDDAQFELVTRKGVYPYDYMDSFEKYDEAQLPSIDKFYNQLEDKKCTPKLYNHAKNVWEKFNIRDLGEYTDLYLKTDILLLADVFENFRKGCRATYNLDPAYYFTLPGYTWACMLKYTRINLELLTDIEMILFIEKGLRGGLSNCMKRRISSNNKYMANYDPSKDSVYIQYYDLNNQYGFAQSQCLPYGGFEWESDPINVMNIPDDSSIGYILEVDLEYGEEIHDLHRDLPFAPEHRTAPNSKEKKLMATLYNKEKYVIHYRALKQALAHGLKVTKTHRILKFEQSAWLKPYIDLNTELRKKATNEFDKDKFKLMNNAVFGKTLENIRNHVNVKLVTRWQGRYGAEARLASPYLQSWTVLDENLLIVEMRKHETYFNKPIYIGMSILDIAKTTLYEFHYDYMIPRYGPNCTAAYVDTDGLIYEIRNQDPYEIVREDCHARFDTSDFLENNIYGIPRVNKKLLGMMKDEGAGRIITDFAGLRAKLYTIKMLPTPEDLKRKREQLEADGYIEEEIDAAIANEGVTKKAKGVKRAVVKNKITFEDYIKCLDESVIMNVTQNLIKSDKHVVYTATQDKIALSPYDDKRYIIQGSYDTLPWGHYSIMDQ